MPRTHGYSLKGQRCYGKRDWGVKGRTNVIGACLAFSFLTVFLVHSYINTNVFISWLEGNLLPVLPPASVVVMDNAAFHQSNRITLCLEQAGHTLEYLPPYSPDLNPIEHKWAQAKACRRKHNCSIDELFKTYCL